MTCTTADQSHAVKQFRGERLQSLDRVRFPVVSLVWMESLPLLGCNFFRVS